MYLYRNPSTFNKSGASTTKTKLTGLQHGPYQLTRFRGRWNVIRGGKAVKISDSCYKCFCLDKKEVTYKGKFFTIYAGFEESSLGKVFVNLDTNPGMILNPKYVPRMQELIDCGAVETYLPDWQRIFNA